MHTHSGDLQERYAALVQGVQSCRLCPRMEGRRRVLGWGNGNVEADVMFVAEAPGRLGAELTGLPLTNDQAGRNFERFLRASGLRREDVFITNAVLCNPRDPRGLNDRPTAAEIRNCSAHLREMVEVVDPRVVVALGRVALQALGRIDKHGAVLSRDVATELAWYGRLLIPLYHPGPRACIRRPLSVQEEDYRKLGEIARWVRLARVGKPGEYAQDHGHPE